MFYRLGKKIQNLPPPFPNPHLGNWIVIVFYISLLMKKIEESRQNNSESGKKQNET